MVIRIAASTAVLSIAAISLAHAQGVASDKLIEFDHRHRRAPARRPRRAGADRIEDRRRPARAEPRQPRGRAQVRSEPHDPQALHRRPQRADRRTQLLDAAGAARPGADGRLPAVQLPRPLRRAALEHDLAGGDRPRRRAVRPVLGALSRQLDRHDRRRFARAGREERELSVRTTAFGENFDQYGARDDYSGYQASAFFGDRFDNGAWFTLAANRQDSTGHPMQYFTISAESGGAVPDGAADRTPTPVTGVVFDTDPFGNRRAVFGANAGAIDHTIQNQWKLRGGYALTDWLEAEGFVAQWRNDTREREPHVHARLDRAAGLAGTGGRGRRRVQRSGQLRSRRARATSGIVQWGTTLRTTRDTGWNGFGCVLRVPHPRGLHAAGEQSRSGCRCGRRPARTPSATARAGRRSSCKACTRRATAIGPTARTRSRSAITATTIKLESPIYNTTDWRSRAGTLAQDVRGETSLQALYAQDAWALADRWVLTLGVRYEDWQASDGFQFVRGARAGGLSVAHRARVVAESVAVVPARRRMAGAPQRRPRRALPDRRGAVPRHGHVDADLVQRSEPRTRGLGLRSI